MERIIEEFLELVKINSNTRNERKMADCLHTKLLALGCEVFEDNVGTKIGGNTGNLHAKLPGSIDGSILLSAHMDRVPNGENITPNISGDIITSDGKTILAADDLAGVCAILDCLRRLQSSNEPHCTIEILFTVSEEIGLAGSRNLDYTSIQSKSAYVLDSSGRVGRIINSAPSKANITINVYGKNAHAGNEPEKGIDAVKAASILLSTIPTGRIDPETVSNFPVFRTNGTETNVVCNYVSIVGEARSRDHSKLEAYLENIQKAAKDIAAQTGAQIDVEIEMDVYAFCVPEEDSVIQNAISAMTTIGITPNVNAGGGCMDANWFNKYGIHAVGLATGYLANHTCDEQLYMDDLILSGRLVEQLVRTYSVK